MNPEISFIVGRIGVVLAIGLAFVFRGYFKKANAESYAENKKSYDAAFWVIVTVFFLIAFIAPVLTGCEVFGLSRAGHSELLCYAKGIVPDLWDKGITYASYALAALVFLVIGLMLKHKEK